MSKAITLRRSDRASEAVKRCAAADDPSMNSWIERVPYVEDMRRRCARTASGCQAILKRCQSVRPGQIATWTSWRVDDNTPRPGDFSTSWLTDETN